MKNLKKAILILAVTFQQDLICCSVDEEQARHFIKLTRKNRGQTYAEIAHEIGVTSHELRQFRQGDVMRAERKEVILNKLGPTLERYNHFVDRLMDFWPSIEVRNERIENQLFLLAHDIETPKEYINYSVSPHNSQRRRIHSSNLEMMAKCIQRLMRSPLERLPLTEVGDANVLNSDYIERIKRVVEALRGFPTDSGQFFAACIVSTLDLSHFLPAELLTHLNRPEIMNYEKAYYLEVINEKPTPFKKALHDRGKGHFNVEQVTSSVAVWFQQGAPHSYSEVKRDLK